MLYLKKMAKLIVDKKKCIGCGTCESLCPNVFALVKGKSKPKKKEIAGEDIKCAKTAETSCPVSAIKIIENEK